jgi:LmbE family N-acetylglucosaminyl deacetylase
MEINKKLTILVLAPHTDDGEFGCGGTIANYARKGNRVIYAAFSAPDQYTLKHLPKDILRSEVLTATETLGIANEDCLIFDFVARKFSENRQEILDKMIWLNNTYKPDIVFLPSINDTHQDHQAIAQEGFRAFKQKTMLAYEVPWNNLEFRTSCFIKLSDHDLSLKISAIGMYQSQKYRNYSKPDFIRSLAVTRGVQIGSNYAETFEVVRWVM